MKTIFNLAILLGLAYVLYSFAGIDNNDEQILISYPAGAFTELEFEGPFEVHLKQGSESKLEINAAEKVHQKLAVNTANGKLSISIPDKVVAKKKSIKVYITVVELDKLIVTGAVKIETTNQLKLKNFKMEFSGAGEISLDVEAEKVISVINGVGSFWLEGSAGYHKVVFSGVGSYNAKNLVCQNTLVESDGVGSVEVFASEKFIGNASGVGSVKYYGKPKVVEVNASGIGKIFGE